MWFHACEVVFVDAGDADAARALVEGPQLTVWAVTPSDAVMEQRYMAWKQSCDEWIDRNRTGESNRGRSIQAY